jgi:eukaryotic-like serine/threonine-protein kinase
MSTEERTGKGTVGETHSTVEFLMRRMRHKGDLPAFSEHIVEINSKLSSLTAITFSSAGDLAKIILKDYSLTNKLLKVVNSALYVTLSGKVATVSKAVLLLGFEKIRVIAATLLIFEHLQSKAQATELKEIAIRSCMSGLIAMDVADNMRLGGKEEVFICAMLHSLGKMLAICYLPEEHEEIKRRMAQKGFDEAMASQSVMGVTYIDLGMAVSRSWNFPDKIVRSMEAPPAGVIAQPRTENEVLRNLSYYSNDLFSCFMNTPDDDRTAALSDMSIRYQNSIPLPVEQMESVITSSMAKIDHYSDIIRADRKNSLFLKDLIQRQQSQHQQNKRRESRRNEADEGKAAGGTEPRTAPAIPDSIASLPSDKVREPPADVRADAPRETADGMAPKVAVTSAPLPAPAVPDSTASPPSDKVKEQPADILTDGLREMADVMAGNYILSDVMYMILETMYRGFEFYRVIFCLMDTAKSKMTARFGLGENADDIVKRFQFLTGRNNDIFNIGISQAKGLIIHDAAAPNILRNIPEWYQKVVGAPSFLIYPLTVKKGCIGMFYADKKEKGRLLTDEQLDYMEKLRNMAIEAITKKHQQ